MRRVIWSEERSGELSLSIILRNPIQELAELLKLFSLSWKHIQKDEKLNWSKKCKMLNPLSCKDIKILNIQHKPI